MQIPEPLWAKQERARRKLQAKQKKLRAEQAAQARSTAQVTSGGAASGNGNGVHNRDSGPEAGQNGNIRRKQAARGHNNGNSNVNANGYASQDGDDDLSAADLLRATL